ncbi:hypothetical protein ABZ235_41630, partial [Streptomyces canus]
MLDRPQRQQQTSRELLRDLAALDQALYEAVTVTSTPALDYALRRLSAAADHSKISFTIAGLLALCPGRPRRAAALGVAAIGVASASANMLGKRLVRRPRPHRAEDSPFPGRHVPMPESAVLLVRGRERQAPARRGRALKVLGRGGELFLLLPVALGGRGVEDRVGLAVVA